jgi:hypothetical protein
MQSGRNHCHCASVVPQLVLVCHSFAIFNLPGLTDYVGDTDI